MTQPYDVEHASAQFQDWLAALKKGHASNAQSGQAMFRAVLHEFDVI